MRTLNRIKTMHYPKDPSEMPRSAVVTSPLMISTPSNKVMMMILFELGEKKKLDSLRSSGKRRFSRTEMFLSSQK